jgi:CRISPR-associated protein Cmr4
MSKWTRMVFLHALTPLHTGTGQTVAVIDLPVAREKATGWPVIPASGLKGVLRDGKTDDDANLLYGSIEAAGALCFGDLRILCLPVRSFYGTFAYVSCPLALARFQRDCTAMGLETPFADIPKVDELSAALPQESALRDSKTGKVYLEDLDLNAQESAEAKTIAEALAGWIFAEGAEAFQARFAIVSDAVFDFLSETATEVTARVRLEEVSKTVASGGLWYEEAVPAEAIFAGPLLVADHRRNDEKAKAALAGLEAGRLLQIGGKASVGRGLCRMVVTE